MSLSETVLGWLWQSLVGQRRLRVTVHLAYFGHLDPARYGIEYVLPPDAPVPGLHVVSLNLLLGLPYVAVEHGRWVLLGDNLIRPQNRFAWLREREPLTRLGGSLWVFRVGEADVRRDRASTTEAPGS